MRFAINLLFNGNCEMALNTYRDLFNAKLICLHRFTGSMTENQEFIGKIFHAELQVNDFFMYMEDTCKELDYEKQPCKITVECNKLEEAQKYYDALLAGGTMIEPFAKMPWGDYMGHLRDRFGITWDIVFSQ